MPDLDTPDVAATPDGGASPDVADSSSAQGTEQSSSDNVTTASSDQSTQEPPDPLSGVPTLEEAQQLQTVSREAFLSLRGEYDKVKPQFQELTTKFSPFEPFADRFQSSDEVQALVTLNESLSGYAPYRGDPNGPLVPNVQPFVEQINTNDPERADYLTNALVWGQTRHPDTGKVVQRTDLILEVMAKNPELRAQALTILGAVDSSSVPAPSWTPDQIELDKLDDPDNPTAEGRALQELYKKLPYETREDLRLSSPEFIKEHLRTKQINDRLLAEATQRETRDREQVAQREQYTEQQAVQAGDQYVEQGFKEGFTNFATHIFETYKPTDNPTINKRESASVALAVVALSHPDTRFAAEQAFKDMGIDQKALDAFNAAREAYAKLGRQHGYLSHKKMRSPEDPGRAQQRLIAQANNLATLITKGRDELFRARTTSFNSELDQATTARLPINGSPQTTQQTTGNRYLQNGRRPTEAELYGG